MIDAVAAEQLVRPFARQHHLDMLGGQLGDEIECDTRRVGQGLVQCVLHLGQRVPVFLLRNAVDIVLDAEFSGQFSGIGAFIIMRAALKAHRKGFLASEIGGDKAGVYPTRQETAHFHVADAVGLHRIGERPVDLVHRFFQGHGFVGPKDGFEIAALFDLPLFEP